MGNARKKYGRAARDIFLNPYDASKTRTSLIFLIEVSIFVKITCFTFGVDMKTP